MQVLGQKTSIQLLHMGIYPNLSTEDELEDVVEDEVASGSIRHQLEALGVVHWSLLLVHLRSSRLAS